MRVKLRQHGFVYSLKAAHPSGPLSPEWSEADISREACRFAPCFATCSASLKNASRLGHGFESHTARQKAQGILEKSVGFLHFLSGFVFAGFCFPDRPWKHGNAERVFSWLVKGNERMKDPIFDVRSPFFRKYLIFFAVSKGEILLYLSAVASPHC